MSDDISLDIHSDDPFVINCKYPSNTCARRESLAANEVNEICSPCATACMCACVDMHAVFAE